MQLVFGLAGAAFGSTFGYAALGWAVGSMIGAAIEGGPDTEGPRLDDLRVTGASYGKDIHRLYGTMRTAGTIIYAQDINEIADTFRVGGFLGFGGGSATNYTYTATFAVALCEGEVADIIKIWADSILVYDSATLEGLVESQLPLSYEFHYGGEDQEQSGILQIYYGADIPAHRGLCYMVFEDWELTQFGNRIPNITAEVISEGASKVFPKQYSQFTTTHTWNTSLPLDTFQRAGMHYEDGTIKATFKAWKEGTYLDYHRKAGWAEHYYDLQGNLLTQTQREINPADIGNFGQAIDAITNTADIHLSNNFSENSQYRWGWMWGDDENTFEPYSQYATAVFPTTLDQIAGIEAPTPWRGPYPFEYGHKYVVKASDGNGAPQIYTGNAIVVRGGRNPAVPNAFWFAGYAAPTRSTKPDNINAWNMEYNDWAYDDDSVSGKGYISLGCDTELKYVYIMYSYKNGFTSGPTFNNGETMVKLNPLTSEILKVWYFVHECTPHNTFIVHQDRLLLHHQSQLNPNTPEAAPASPRLTSAITYIQHIKDDPNAEWDILWSGPSINAWEATPVGTNGVVALRENPNFGDNVWIMSMATTVSASGTVSLEDVVTDISVNAGVDQSDIDAVSLASTGVNGFILTTSQSARESIGQLQTGYIFDIVESDWKIKFKARA